MTNTKTKVLTGFESIAESILMELNLASLDDESRQFNQSSGEVNPFYNSDAVYLIGGICDQLAYSLIGNTCFKGSSKGKIDYLNTCQTLADKEERDNPSTYVGSIQNKNLERATASYDNTEMLFMAMVETFNAVTGWTWGGSSTFESKGRPWFAEHKESMQAKRTADYSPKISPTEKRAEMLAKLRAKN